MPPTLGLMSFLPTDRIQETIRNCIARCQNHDQPLTCIAETIEQLRADVTWTHAEIAQVEAAVRKILARLIHPE